jgi:hypothetical protein
MPTASPTPSNYAVAYFNVSQVLANITVAQFDTYNAIAAFVTAVVGSSDGTVPTSAQVYVRDTTAIVINLHTKAASQISGTVVFYSISFYVDNDSSGALNTAYSSVTEQLTNAIATGTFQSLMVEEASITGASGLYYSLAADAPTYYDYVVVSSHSTPSTQANLTVKLSSSLLASSIGILICFVASAAYYVRSFSRAHLESAVDGGLSTVPALGMKAISASLVLLQLLIVEDRRGYILLWLSRSVAFMGWLVILFLLLMPSKRIEPDSPPNVNLVPLSLKLYGPAVGYGVNVDSSSNICGFRSLAITTNIAVLLVCAWDVTLVPLLPWTKTTTTELLHGYPSLPICRVCLYTPLAVQTIQLAYSIFLLLTSQNNLSNNIFEVVTILYWLYTLLRTALFLQFTRNEELNLAVVNVSDLRKFNEGDAFQVTVMSGEDFSYLQQYLGAKTNSIASSVNSTVDTADGHEITVHDVTTEAHADNVSVMMSYDRSEQVAEDIKHTTTPQLGSAVAASSCGDGETINLRELQEAEGLQEFRAATPYADETAEILKKQLRDVGVLPLKYIPKDELQKEINQLVAAANSGTCYDESRLDYLLRCLDVNPQYQVHQLCFRYLLSTALSTNVSS